MINVLDAYAVVAALVGERAAADVQPLLAEGVISSANLAEVVDVCIRIHRNPERDVRERIGWLVSGGLTVAPLEPSLAVAAGALRARHYRRRHCEVSLGDCIALALAQHRRAPLATSDPDLASVARTEQVDVLALPDSRGKLPQAAATVRALRGDAGKRERC